MRNPYLIGDQVYLRPLTREDAAVMQPWMNDSEVTRNLLLWRPMRLEDELEFIERSGRDPSALSLGIVLRQDDRLIGTLGLSQIDWRDRRAAFGIEIGDRQQWGKGLGTESTRLIVRHAFETMNLHRVWLLVYEHNLRGQRCYERVGFRREGVLRQYHWSDGRYWDALIMAILREEWQAMAVGASR